MIFTYFYPEHERRVQFREGLPCPSVFWSSPHLSCPVSKHQDGDSQRNQFEDATIASKMFCFLFHVCLTCFTTFTSLRLLFCRCFDRNFEFTEIYPEQILNFKLFFSSVCFLNIREIWIFNVIGGFPPCKEETGSCFFCSHFHFRSSFWLATYQDYLSFVISHMLCCSPHIHIVKMYAVYIKNILISPCLPFSFHAYVIKSCPVLNHIVTLQSSEICDVEQNQMFESAVTSEVTAKIW